MPNVLFVLLVGCSSGSTQPPISKPVDPAPAVVADANVEQPPVPTDPIAAMNSYSRRMCACKDFACGAKVHDDRVRWVTELMKTGYKPDRENWARADDILGDYEKCMMAIMDAEGFDAATMDAFSKQMCECRDPACTVSVHAGFKKATSKTGRADPATPDKTRSVVRYVECLTIMSKLALRGER